MKAEESRRWGCSLWKALLPGLLGILTLCSCGGPLGEVRFETEVPPTAPSFESGKTVHQLRDYFLDLAIGSEYIDYSNLCRWEDPIRYSVTGEYDTADSELIERLCADLNIIPGFPGIAPVSEGEAANLVIEFVPAEEMENRFIYGEESGVIEGLTQYTASGETYHIMEAKVSIDCSMESRRRRDSAICEEIVQSLGLGNDSLRYIDSIFYEGATLADYPSPLDFDMLRLMYSSEITPGMTAAELRVAVERLLGIP